MNTSIFTYWLAILLGALLSAFLSSALVLAGLRAGITPGVSPLLVLSGWALLSPILRKDKSYFLLILQTTGSAGAAVTAGVIFTAPILQIATPDGIAPAVAIYPLLYASIAGALLGWGCVGLSSMKMVADPQLPAPEAVACNEILELAKVDEAKQRPSILFGLVLPAMASFFTAAGVLLKVVKENVATLSFAGASIPIPVSPLYIGIGAILSLETAILLAAGGFGHSAVRAYSAAENLPDDTFRWIGAAAMTVSIVYTLLCYLSERYQEFRASSGTVGREALPQKFLWLGVLAGVVLGLKPLYEIVLRAEASIALIAVFAVLVVVLALLLSAIGALLSLQVGSSASPVSATVFVGMLVLAAVCSLVMSEPSLEVIVLLLVTLCVAICAANDSSQDYRTILLQERPIRLGYFPQLIGLLAGALVVPATLWVAHESFYLGSSELPAPQASFFSVVLLSLLEQSRKPVAAILFGLGLGVFAILLEHLAKRRGRVLSSVSFCVGLYLPPAIGVGILLGAVCRSTLSLRLFARKRVLFSASTAILAAASYISVDAAVSLLFGVASIFGLYAPNAQMLPERYTQYAGSVSILSLLSLLGLLAFCFAGRRSEAP